MPRPPRRTKPDADPAQIFLSAEAWHASGMILTTQYTGMFKPERPQFSFPANVLYALSIEFYFKCAAYRENQNGYLATHSFIELFDDLTFRMKEKIAQNFDRLYESNKLIAMLPPDLNMPRSLAEALERAEGTFDKVRYHHEGMPQNWGFIPGPIIGALRTTLLEEEPTWPISDGAPPVLPRDLSY